MLRNIPKQKITSWRLLTSTLPKPTRWAARRYKAHWHAAVADVVITHRDGAISVWDM